MEREDGGDGGVIRKGGIGDEGEILIRRYSGYRRVGGEEVVGKGRRWTEDLKDEGELLVSWRVTGFGEKGGDW